MNENNYVMKLHLSIMLRKLWGLGIWTIRNKVIFEGVS